MCCQYSYKAGNSFNDLRIAVLIFILLLFFSGDIELNPGPNKTNSSWRFSVCH